MSSPQAEICQPLLNCLIQPFDINFSIFDYHVIVFFEHPEYESVEAMIKLREGMFPFVRAILTGKDKTQADYINDSSIFGIAGSNAKREVYYTPVSCNLSGKEGKTRIKLGFSSHKGEEIILDTLPAAKTTSRYAGLIDPLGHSKSSSLPVMYVEKVSLIHPESKVYIKGIAYRIPVKIRIPLLFKGLNGFSSELFNIGVFRAGERSIKLLHSPKKLQIGEKWIYSSDNSVSGYEIKSLDNDMVTIAGDNEKILLETTCKGILLKKVQFYAVCKNGSSVLSIDFAPGLNIFPACDHTNQGNLSGFSISVNRHKSVITGIAEATMENNIQQLLIRPHKPDWAAERQVSTTIIKSGDEFTSTTRILNIAK